MDPSIVFGGMKIVCLIALLSFLVGCGRSELTLAAIQKAAARSEVIILADVRKKDGKDSLFAREVLKGRLSPEFRFRIGEEIDPQFEHSLSIGRGNKPTEQMLIFYRPQMGVMTCSRMLSCSQGQIQALHGPEADLAAFVAQLKKEANSEDSVAPKRAPTPRSN